MADRTYRAANHMFLSGFRLLGLDIDVRGLEHLPTTGPAVIACNHLSYLDFTFVGYAARMRGRYVRFMAKRPVFETPLVGPLMRAMRHIPVDRRAGAGALFEATSALRQGELVGIFPESTISRSWMLKPFQPGAAALAIRCQVPLVPMVTWGGHRVVTVDKRWSLDRGKAVTILIGAPFAPAPEANVETVLADLRTRMDALLTEAQNTYPDRPSGPDDLWWVPASRGGAAPPVDDAAALDTAALARSRA